MSRFKKRSDAELDMLDFIYAEMKRHCAGRGKQHIGCAHCAYLTGVTAAGTFALTLSLLLEDGVMLSEAVNSANTAMTQVVKGQNPVKIAGKLNLGRRRRK